MEVSHLRDQAVDMIVMLKTEAGPVERSLLSYASNTLKSLVLNSQQLELSGLMQELNNFLSIYRSNCGKPDDYRFRRDDCISCPERSDRELDNIKHAEEVVEYIDALETITGVVRSPAYQECVRRRKKVVDYEPEGDFLNYEEQTSVYENETDCDDYLSDNQIYYS